jgi:transcription elongation factor GreA
MDKIYLSREGYDKLLKELDRLKSVKRRQLSKEIEYARSLGDLRENAEYAAAKEAQALNEKVIRELEDKLTRVEIIDDKDIAHDKVYVGAKVAMVDVDSGLECEYTLAGQEEADPSSGSISVTSPIAKALLGHAVGEIVEVKIPKGTLRYKITAISR